MFCKLVLVMVTLMFVTKGGDCQNQRKVYFQAWNSATNSTNIAAGTVLVYDRKNTNKGDGYDSSTGEFTAPRSGPYVFKWTVTTQDGYSMNAELHLNGRRIGIAQADGQGPQNASGSNTVILELKKGDVVNIKCGDWNPQSKRQFYGGPVSTFAGWSL